jgi:hypothetical protein
MSSQQWWTGLSPGSPVSGGVTEDRVNEIFSELSSGIVDAIAALIGDPTTNRIRSYVVGSINLLATGRTLVVPVLVSSRFIPTGALLRLTTVTGAIVGAPVVRLGNNGAFNNIAPLRTLVSAAAQAVEVVPLNTQITAVDVGTTGISLDVQTAGTGSSVLIGEIIVSGIFVT